MLTLAPTERRSIAQVLDSVALPGFEDHVVTSRVMTPQDFHDRLYIVGAGTHPGAGVPGVLCSAKILDKVVPHAALL